MEHGAQANLFDFRIIHSHRFGDQRRIGGDFLRVALCVVILGVDGKRQRRDRVQHGLRQRLRALSCRHGCFAGIRFGGGERFGELPQALVDFFERLRSRGEKPLERHAQVRLEDVAFPFFRFIGIEVIGSRDGVSTLMLRKVHRSVGYLDELLRR